MSFFSPTSMTLVTTSIQLSVFSLNKNILNSSQIFYQPLASFTAVDKASLKAEA